MSDLVPGDTIDVAVTHEVVINGTKSWVKLGVRSKVEPGEDAHDAVTRVADVVNVEVIKVIESTANAVITYRK